VVRATATPHGLGSDLTLLQTRTCERAPPRWWGPFSLVGDTGIEPVTSSVSAPSGGVRQVVCPGHRYAMVSWVLLAVALVAVLRCCTPSARLLSMTRAWCGRCETMAMTHPGVIPFNANVVVTSQSPTGLRVLLLHPSDIDTYDGDWAWVPPGGCREPDEDIATCARRELEEETGIVAVPEVVVSEGVDIAIFSLDVPWGTPVRLSSEHTDADWVAVEQLHQRCRPAAVLSTIRTATAAIRATVRPTDPDRGHSAPSPS
jgi:8-oxo-dGTP pyrophosphatase MutT (NUDIX family)